MSFSYAIYWINYILDSLFYVIVYILIILRIQNIRNIFKKVSTVIKLIFNLLVVTKPHNPQNPKPLCVVVQCMSKESLRRMY